jgi:uncharacterized protein YjeT (DUF2065 family)
LPEWSVGQDFLSALALLLVIEGILPFARPAALRRVLAQMSELNDRSLRISGLVSMILGAGLLYLARH